ncbi:unnamed protein product, partial [Prorocentrum cordatum]
TRRSATALAPLCRGPPPREHCPPPAQAGSGASFRLTWRRHALAAAGPPAAGMEWQGAGVERLTVVADEELEEEWRRLQGAPRPAAASRALPPPRGPPLAASAAGAPLPRGPPPVPRPPTRPRWPAAQAASLLAGGRLVGVVQDFNARVGMGRIACRGLGGPVAVAAAELAGFSVGDAVSFSLGADPKFGNRVAVTLEAEDDDSLSRASACGCEGDAGVGGHGVGASATSARREGRREQRRAACLQQLSGARELLAALVLAGAATADDEAALQAALQEAAAVGVDPGHLAAAEVGSIRVRVGLRQSDLSVQAHMSHPVLACVSGSDPPCGPREPRIKGHCCW